MNIRLDHVLISLHEHFPARITEWLLSVILFSWGVTTYFMPAEHWALISSGFTNIASQTTWAVYAITIGIGRIAALIINGTVRRSPHARGMGAFLSILVWVYISLDLIVSPVRGEGLAVFPWLAFADVFNVYRAAKDARLSDHQATERRRTAARRVPKPT